MLRLAFDFIITWRETRTRPNAYISCLSIIIFHFPAYPGFIPSSLLFLFPMRCELESYLISSACYLLAIKFTEIKSLLA